jgi:hypothetical protein
MVGASAREMKGGLDRAWAGGSGCPGWENERLTQRAICGWQLCVFRTQPLRDSRLRYRLRLGRTITFMAPFSPA